MEGLKVKRRRLATAVVVLIVVIDSGFVVWPGAFQFWGKPERGIGMPLLR